MPSKKDVHIYVDDDTGDQYIFDGTNLVKLPKGGGQGKAGSGGGGNQDNDFDDENDSFDDSNDDSDNDNDDFDNDDDSDSSNDSNKKDKNRKPRIGDKADLSDEDAEREEKARKEREESGEDEESAEERQARLDRIKRYLSSDKIGDQVNYESEQKVTAERQRKKAAQKKELEKNLSGAKRNNRVLELLKQDLQQFLGKIVGQEKRTASWRKYNGNYDGSGLIRPGYRNEPVGKIPVIQLYLDQSSSWTDDDVKLANDILKSIKEFEDKKLLKVQVYYFADDVHNTAEAARREGATHAGPIIMQQLNEQKPDNVIIITDGDFDGQGFSGQYTAPGGVWMVFKGVRSMKLMKGLKGRMLTHYYDIDKI